MMALLYTLYFRALEFLTGLSVAMWEFRAYCLDFPPIWICDGCGFAFRTMRGAQWHERGHKSKYCLTEDL